VFKRQRMEGAFLNDSVPLFIGEDGQYVDVQSVIDAAVSQGIYFQYYEASNEDCEFFTFVGGKKKRKCSPYTSRTKRTSTKK
ncbi:Hypothetical predicted protein, partial [Pelobates cultripes]